MGDSLSLSDTLIKINRAEALYLLPLRDELRGVELGHHRLQDLVTDGGQDLRVQN